METVTGFLTEGIPSVSTIVDYVGDAVGTTLQNTVGRVLYIIVSGISWFLSVIYQLFEVFSGQMKVKYDGDYEYLTNIFFENSTISGIYWGMAIIGVVLCFAFTIIAVIRKMFDGSDKIQASLGAILGSMCKSLLLILSLNAVMVVVLNFSNVLMQQMIYTFNAGSSLTESQRIDFTDDQFATMGRVLNTVGNYSLNPSYRSRYNLNSCFNAIRGDMLYLQQQGVFEFFYYTEDADGNEIVTWQSALQSLVFAADLEKELSMDIYNEAVANALLDLMDTLQNNKDFYPLEYFERAPIPINNIPLDRVLFLACTYDAALNERFNINPSHTDALRGPYYNGQKSIYDYEQVLKDFDLVFGFNYIVFGLAVYGIFKEMIYILLDCIARIYNMVLLYLVAPPFIAVSPLDNGGKMKQWTLAFVVQCFGVFGSVISMRLLLTFLPIIVSTRLELFTNPVIDIYAKSLLIRAGFMAAKKASAMITGILADSAGWQSITAGNLRGDWKEMKKKAEDKAEKKKQEARQRAQEARQRAQEAMQMQKEQAQGKDQDQNQNPNQEQNQNQNQNSDQNQNQNSDQNQNQNSDQNQNPNQEQNLNQDQNKDQNGTTQTGGKTTPTQTGGKVAPPLAGGGKTTPTQTDGGKTTPTQTGGKTTPTQTDGGKTTPTQTGGKTAPTQTGGGFKGIPAPPKMTQNVPRFGPNGRNNNPIGQGNGQPGQNNKPIGQGNGQPSQNNKPVGQVNGQPNRNIGDRPPNQQNGQQPGTGNNLEQKQVIPPNNGQQQQPQQQQQQPPQPQPQQQQQQQPQPGQPSQPGQQNPVNEGNPVNGGGVVPDAQTINNPQPTVVTQETVVIPPPAGGGAQQGTTENQQAPAGNEDDVNLKNAPPERGGGNNQTE